MNIPLWAHTPIEGEYEPNLKLNFEMKKTFSGILTKFRFKNSLIASHIVLKITAVAILRPENTAYVHMAMFFNKCIIM
jgi:hypothetical protein